MTTLNPYPHPVKFICQGCLRSFNTLLGYWEHIEGARRADTHFGRQCEYAVYSYLCAAAECKDCGIKHEALVKSRERVN